MESHNFIHDLSKNYPILNILIPVMVAYVMARKDVKKYFKTIEEDKKKAEIQRTIDLENSNNHRKNQEDAMAKLTESITKLGDAMVESTAQFTERFMKAEARMEVIAQQGLDNSNHVKDLTQKLVYLETSMQLWPHSKKEEQ